MRNYALAPWKVACTSAWWTASGWCVCTVLGSWPVACGLARPKVLAGCDKAGATSSKAHTFAWSFRGGLSAPLDAGPAQLPAPRVLGVPNSPSPARIRYIPSRARAASAEKELSCQDARGRLDQPAKFLSTWHLAFQCSPVRVSPLVWRGVWSPRASPVGGLYTRYSNILGRTDPLFPPGPGCLRSTSCPGVCMSAWHVCRRWEASQEKRTLKEKEWESVRAKTKMCPLRPRESCGSRTKGTVRLSTASTPSTGSTHNIQALTLLLLEHSHHTDRHTTSTMKLIRTRE